MLCGSYICKPCITVWAKSKLIMDRLSGEVLIPCPNYLCEHSLSHIDMITFLGVEMFEEINTQYTDIYLSNTHDIRRCPNEECNYAGTIKLESCNEKLTCSECGFTWMEYVQLSETQKAIKSLKEFFTLKGEIFSYINEVLTGCPCPKCGLMIWKDGGCSHMVWQKCKHEFWWECLGHFPGYCHREQTFCPLRTWITFQSLLIFFVLLDIKLCTHVPFVFTAHIWIYIAIFIIFFYFLLPNAVVLAVLLEAYFISATWDGFKEWAINTIERKIAYVTVVCWVLYPIGYAYLWYRILISTKLFFIAKSIWYEILIVLALVLMWVGGVLLFYVAKLVFSVMYTVWSKMRRILSKVFSVICLICTKIRQVFYLSNSEKNRMKLARVIKQRLQSRKRLKTS